MIARFKRMSEDTVMCTAQGCSEVAQFFCSAPLSPGSNRPVTAAYCEVHAADAAKRVGHPWPISDPKPSERTGRRRGASAG
jgi:hypothetical protein